MWSRCEGNYGLNSTFTGLGYLYYFWHPGCHCFHRDTPSRSARPLYAGKLAKRADNWDRCYFPDAPTMILVRENAPRHRIPNLYRFYRIFFFSHRAFRFSERRCPHRQHQRSSKMRFFKVEIQPVISWTDSFFVFRSVNYITALDEWASSRSIWESSRRIVIFSYNEELAKTRTRILNSISLSSNREWRMSWVDVHMALFFRLHPRKWRRVSLLSSTCSLSRSLPSAAVVECRDAAEREKRDVFYAREDTVQIPCACIFTIIRCARDPKDTRPRDILFAHAQPRNASCGYYAAVP